MSPLNPPGSTPTSPSPLASHPTHNRSSRRWGFLTWERSLLLLMLLAGIGYGLWQGFGPKAGPPQAQGGPPAKPQGPPPRPVVTTSLQPGTEAQRVQVLGQVEASETTTLRSQTSGTVQDVWVKEGDRVQPGQLIAKLNPADQVLAQAQAQAKLAEAESNLAELKRGTRPEVIRQRQAAVRAAIAREAEARDNLNRVKNLVTQGALAERQLIEAKTRLDTVVSDRLEAEADLADAQAGPRIDELNAETAKVAAEQAAVTQARLELQRTEIRATASGVVSDRTINVGDYVRSADPILTLIDPKTVEITLELPEQLAGQVQPGLAVKLTSRALPGWETTATINALLPIASTSSRRQPARIRLGNPPQGLLPGTAVVAQFKTPGNSSGYRVSRDALTRRADQWLVFGIRDGVAQQVEVSLISDLGETVIIDSPALNAQQAIVLKGGDALTDGAPVMVMDGPGAMPPPGAGNKPQSEPS